MTFSFSLNPRYLDPMSLMAALTDRMNASMVTPSQTSGFLNSPASSRADMTRRVVMEKLSCSRTASIMLCASSTIRTIPFSSVSRLERKFSRMSGSIMWMYGATTTSKSFISAFLAS